MLKMIDVRVANLCFYRVLLLVLCSYSLMGCSVFSAAGTAISTTASVAGSVVGGAISVVKP